MALVDTTTREIAFTGEVHPAAAAWPTLSEEELAELASSIAEIGLTDALTLDPKGRLLDGRNRLEACRIAEVEPTFVVYAGDPIAFIIAKNADRRHMSSGARAMATAAVLADAGRRENGRWTYGALSGSGQSGDVRKRLAEAGLVIDFCPQDAPKVIAGDLALDAAYQKARRVKAVAESYDQRLAALKDEAPDLAKHVNDETSLVEAEAALAARKVEHQKLHKVAAKHLEDFLSGWIYMESYVNGSLLDVDAVLALLIDKDRTELDRLAAIIRKGMS